MSVSKYYHKPTLVKLNRLQFTTPKLFNKFDIPPSSSLSGRFDIQNTT